jgi:hypothetical protein
MAAAAAAHRSNFSDPDIVMTPPEPRPFLPHRSGYQKPTPGFVSYVTIYADVNRALAILSQADRPQGSVRYGLSPQVPGFGRLD